VGKENPRQRKRILLKEWGMDGARFHWEKRLK
jgi:hypothetical protein